MGERGDPSSWIYPSENVPLKLTGIHRRGERRLRVWCIGNQDSESQSPDAPPSQGPSASSPVDGESGPIDDLPRRIGALIDRMVDTRDWDVSIEVTASDTCPEDVPWDQDVIVGECAPDLGYGKPAAGILRDLY